MTQKQEHTPNKLTQVLKDFCTSLSIPLQDLMVVGSLSLYRHGFQVKTHDVDVEFRNPTPLHLKLLTLLHETAGREEYPVLEGERFTFLYKEIPFDVWVVKEFNSSPDTILEKDRIQYANVTSILKKKKQYGRKKDWDVLSSIAVQVLS